MCSNLEAENEDLKAVGALPQDDVDQRSAARASTDPEVNSKTAEHEIPSKKRKTRRGRNKRRHPYLNRGRKSSNVIKPEAPHNSNQFLIEDQGNSYEIDEQLKNDKIVSRTRDSSFSMDSDCEFYSSPEDEESFLRKDFDDTYENLRAERLNQMSKNELIEEFLQLEKRVDFLNKRIKAKFGDIDIDVDEEKTINDNTEEFQKEIERLLLENETLKRENSDLRNKIPVSNTDSKDSESDSSDSCSSCSSSASESAKEVSPPASPEEAAAVVDYTQTNGHSPTNLQPV